MAKEKSRECYARRSPVVHSRRLNRERPGDSFDPEAALRAGPGGQLIVLLSSTRRRQAVVSQFHLPLRGQGHNEIASNFLEVL